MRSWNLWQVQTKPRPEYQRKKTEPNSLPRSTERFFKSASPQPLPGFSLWGEEKISSVLGKADDHPAKPSSHPNRRQYLFGETFPRKRSPLGGDFVQRIRSRTESSIRKFHHRSVCGFCEETWGTVFPSSEGKEGALLQTMPFCPSALRSISSTDRKPVLPPQKKSVFRLKLRNLG